MRKFGFSLKVSASPGELGAAFLKWLAPLALGLAVIVLLSTLEDRALKKAGSIPLLDSKEALLSAMRGTPARCAIRSAPITGRPAADPMGIVQMDCLAFIYKTERYETIGYTDRNGLSSENFLWQEKDWVTARSSEAYLYGDIPLSLADMSDFSLLTDLSPDTPAALPAANGSYLDEMSRYVIPDPEGYSRQYPPETGEYYFDGHYYGALRYTGSYLPVDTPVSFVADVGGGKIAPGENGYLLQPGDDVTALAHSEVGDGYVMAYTLLGILLLGYVFVYTPIRIWAALS